MPAEPEVARLYTAGVDTVEVDRGRSRAVKNRPQVVREPKSFQALFQRRVVVPAGNYAVLDGRRIAVKIEALIAPRVVPAARFQLRIDCDFSRPGKCHDRSARRQPLEPP